MPERTLKEENMNEQDREDVLMIVEAVLESYLTESFTKKLLGAIDQSIKDTWHILKIIRERKTMEVES